VDPRSAADTAEVLARGPSLAALEVSGSGPRASCHNQARPDAGRTVTRAPGSWRRTAARASVVVGVALAASAVLPEIPKENLIRLQLKQASGPISRVDLTWTRVGTNTPAGGVSLRFREKAPKLVEHSVLLREGDYRLDVVVHDARPGPAGTSTSTHRLHLAGGETTVFVARRHVVQPPHSRKRGFIPRPL
jgi:hypothetical protein